MFSHRLAVASWGLSSAIDCSSFVKRTRNCHRLPDEHRNCLKGSDGENLVRDEVERMIMGFSERIDAIELNKQAIHATYAVLRGTLPSWFLLYRFVQLHP